MMASNQPYWPQKNYTKIWNQNSATSIILVLICTLLLTALWVAFKAMAASIASEVKFDLRFEISNLNYHGINVHVALHRYYYPSNYIPNFLYQLPGGKLSLSSCFFLSKTPYCSRYLSAIYLLKNPNCFEGDPKMQELLCHLGKTWKDIFLQIVDRWEIFK